MARGFLTWWPSWTGTAGTFQHSGDRLLCRGPDRGPRPRKARRIQHRPGKPVHQPRVHADILTRTTYLSSGYGTRRSTKAYAPSTGDLGYRTPAEVLPVDMKERRCPDQRDLGRSAGVPLNCGLICPTDGVHLKTTELALYYPLTPNLSCLVSPREYKLSSADISSAIVRELNDLIAWESHQFLIANSDTVLQCVLGEPPLSRPSPRCILDTLVTRWPT